VSDTRRELYVYYRVATVHWRDAADAVAHWQQRLEQARPGLSARVLRRPETRDDAITLMEVYAGSATIDTAIEAVIARGAPELHAWLLGERHIERFDALD
jgi:hypothetical protein